VERELTLPALAAEHFQYDENEECPAESTATQQVDKGPTGCGEYWCDYE